MASVVAEGFTASQPRFQPQALRKVLIANRGEIALRLIRTCKALGLPTVSVYTNDDAAAPHASAADEAFLLEGKESDGKGYLDQQAIIDICKRTGANCILPGYGFLSENPGFAKLVESNDGLIFAGPRSETINSFGLKHQARALAEKAGVPCVPGTNLLKSADEALQAAEKITYPVILKSTAGGGGLGLQVCKSSAELKNAFDKITSRGKALFGDASVFLEKYVEKGRHVEVQVFGNGQGQAIHFGERECSIQRRHQKVIEECPSPFVHKTPGLREKVASCAVALAESAKYRSAGTVEMLVDDDTASFYFLEVNARLQVEHCVTELCYDIDLVALMLMQADAELSGKGGIPAETLSFWQKDGPKGVAIEARLYAENPIRDYAPTPGLLQYIEYATGNVKHPRIDGWVSSGTKVSASYDPMLSKICVWGESRDAAITDMSTLLNKSKVQGTPTNLGLLRAITASKLFATGKTLTSFLTPASGFKYQPCAFEVITGGISTTVQDHNGRKGVGHGVPEAGAMDPLSLQVGNLIVGNPAGTEALEITLAGPELLFHAGAVVALAGAEMDMTLDGKPVECYTRIVVQAGSKLKITKVADGAAGCRSYLVIRGGLPEVAIYLNSKSTCPSLALGGYQGRALLAGDTLEMDPTASELASSGKVQPYSLPKDTRLTKLFDESNSDYGWPLLCMAGPFDDDGFLTTKDRQKLYGTSWKVSHQASRTGIRLEGPRYKWARKDGGEGGSHPSNVLEFGYSSRGINMNGDVPVILGRDGPDLGGLLISNTIISSEWRDGQMKPSDKLRFVAVTYDKAREISDRVEKYLSQIKNAVDGRGEVEPLSMQVVDHLYAKGDFSQSNSILASIDEVAGERPMVKIRSAGDRFIVIEYGDMTADIINRCRIELLVRELVKTKSTSGFVDLNPNLRSVTIQIDPAKVNDLQGLVNWLAELETKIPNAKDVKIPTREFTLPVTFEDREVKLSVQKYMELVRSKAVYLPDNSEYLAEANGYKSTREVEEAVVGCRQLAVSVGFFMGTPILLPLDPRKRMRCQKYNPTRLTTPAGALGHGGSCFAIYPVSCPGRYALLGRTLPCWSTFGDKPGFKPTQPYLFENFDTIQFEKVDQATYDQALREFDAGIYKWKVKETVFDVAEQSQFLESIKEATEEFRKQQAVSLKKAEEKEEKLFAEWQQEVEEAEKRKAAGQTSGDGQPATLKDFAHDASAIPISSGLAANVWKVLAKKGDKVEPGQKVAILEAMKMEIDVVAPDGCKTIKAVLKPPGSSVNPGDAILVAGSE